MSEPRFNEPILYGRGPVTTSSWWVGKDREAFARERAARDAIHRQQHDPVKSYAPEEPRRGRPRKVEL